MAGSSFGSGGGSEDDAISGINITPLVDVVLVLLVIFLITAPVIYQSAIKVKLPSAQTGEASDKSTLTFTINKEGEVAWGDEKLSWEALGAKLTALTDAQKEEPAMISADETAHHGTVVKLMDLLRKAGLTRFALNVDSGAAN